MRQGLRILWIPALLFFLAGFVTRLVTRAGDNYAISLGIQLLWFMAGFSLAIVWIGALRHQARDPGCAALLALSLAAAVSILSTVPR